MFDSYVGLAVRNDLANDEFRKRIIKYKNIVYEGFPNDGWDVHWARVWEFPAVLNSIEKYADNCSLDIVESGCGITPVPCILSSFGHNVTGIDLELEQSLSDKWSGLHVPGGGDLNFVIGDMLAMPFNEQTFDVAYSISAIEHTGNAPLAVSELIRVTRPKGLISFTMDIEIENTDSVPFDHLEKVQEILHKTTTPLFEYRISSPAELLTFTSRTINPQHNIWLGFKYFLSRLGMYKWTDQCIFFYAGIKL